MAEIIDTGREPDRAIERACAVLAEGEPVAIPTETVYGLAADATNPDAISRIYEMKGRPRFNPLISHVSDMAMAEAHVRAIDAIIGLSVVYKALDNLGAFQRWFGCQPDTRLATLLFGLIHGFGLASKLLDFELASDGLVANLIAFNVGVELGQLLALGAILILMGYWRRSPGFWRHAYGANVALLSTGFLLTGYQLGGLILS